MRLLRLTWIAFLTASAQWKSANGFVATPFRRHSSHLDGSLILYSTRSSVRRKVLQFPTGVILVASSLSWPKIAWSEESSGLSSSPTTKRPYAPVEALLPAVRVQMMIDRATKLASLLSKNEATLNKQEAIQELELLLLQPQNYTRSLSLSPVPKQPSKQYLDSYQRNLDQMNLLQKPGALLVQSGEIDAWRRLKRQERVQEQNDEIRAALNVYTTNLSFDADSYLLNVPKNERSKMIREGRLPDVKSVIASDMGMRYLYRNNILTAVDEAKAEVRFQLKQPTFDASELAELLQTAQNAYLQWFSLIDEKDVQEAYDVLQVTRPVS